MKRYSAAVKTQKILEIRSNGLHVECIRDNSTTYNPYRVIYVWYDHGWHRKTLVKYQDFESVIYYLSDIVRQGRWSVDSLCKVIENYR